MAKKKSQPIHDFVVIYDKGSSNIMEHLSCTVDQLYKYIGKLQRKYSNVEWYFRSEY